MIYNCTYKVFEQSGVVFATLHPNKMRIYLEEKGFPILPEIAEVLDKKDFPDNYLYKIFSNPEDINIFIILEIIQQNVEINL